MLTATEQPDLAALNAISEALNCSPDVRGALTRSLALVAEPLGMQAGWILLHDAENRARAAALAVQRGLL